MNKAEDLTTEELEAALAKRKKSEKAKAEREKKEYETHRDKMINFHVTNALDLRHLLSIFKKGVENDLKNQQIKLTEYGRMRSNSKGGFSVTNKEGTMRITRTRNTEPTWDERGQKALDLIKEFLETSVKKRNKKLHALLMSFLEKNQKGDLEYASVMKLIQHEDSFTDDRWIEGLRLLKESYQVHMKGYGYVLQTRDTTDKKWETINLNFSSL